MSGPGAADALGGLGPAPAPSARAPRPGSVADAAQRFEGLVISQLLKQGLGGASGEGGLFGQGAEGGVYQGFLETFLADHLSKAGGLGLARVLERSLGGTPS